MTAFKTKRPHEVRQKLAWFASVGKRVNVIQKGDYYYVEEVKDVVDTANDLEGVEHTGESDAAV